MKILERTQFGDPILRRTANTVPIQKISSKPIQSLIEDMRYTLQRKKLGVGLAAPQVGHNIALAVVSVRPTKTRPNAEKFDIVMINPVILKIIGKSAPMWEGCISAGSSGKADLFAKVPRHNKIKVTFYDEHANKFSKTFVGLPAQIIQHEVDHLNGILFVDRVEDTKSYMTYKQYISRVKKLAN